MKRIIRLIGILALVLLLLIGFLLWMVNASVRQAQLDHALIQAIKAEDSPKILAVLAQGANGDARDTDKQPTARETLFLLLDRFRLRHPDRIEQRKHVPALVRLFWNSAEKRNDIHDGKPWPGPDPVVVRALLDHGARADEGDEANYTPLYYASEFSNADVVRLLLERGANIEAQEVHGGDRPLMVASVGVTIILLDHGADINAVNRSNQTALMLAARRGEVEIVRILLEHGANDNTRDQFGSTALDLAKHCLQSTPDGKLKMVDMLTKYASNHSEK